MTLESNKRFPFSSSLIAFIKTLTSSCVFKRFNKSSKYLIAHNLNDLCNPSSISNSSTRELSIPFLTSSLTLAVNVIDGKGSPEDIVVHSLSRYEFLTIRR